MKKIIMPIMALATVTASFANMQNLTNKKVTNYDDTKFQLQLVINNLSQDTLGFPTLYLDININDRTYNNDDYTLQNRGNPYFNKNFVAGAYKDTFRTNINSKVTLYTLSLDPTIKSYATWSFTFGTFTGLHYQLTSSPNPYTYDYYANFLNTKNNGTRIVINLYGHPGANSANWGLEYYKF